MSPLTGVLREAWDLYRRHVAHFLAISFTIYIVAAILAAVLVGVAGTAGGLLAVLVNLFAAWLVQAALVTAVQDVRDGRVDLSVRDTVSSAARHLLPVAGASILASIGITVGFILLLVPGLILLTFWSLIVPAIVIGRSSALDAFGHSWRTVRGYGWNVFGTYLIVYCIWVIIEIVLSILLIAAPPFLHNLVSEVVAGGLLAPLLAAVVTLVYVRLTAAHGGGRVAGGDVTV